MSKQVISVHNLSKRYKIGQVETLAVNNVSLDILEGEFVAITGKSGSGKSTLMYQMSLLDYPSEGYISVNGVRSENWNEQERTRMRLNQFGYVFQSYALIPELKAVENVAIPLYMTGLRYKDCVKKAKELLESVGLGSRLDNRPSQLSGGEQQRVSIARALVNNPKVLFADEPTANLDSATSKRIMEIFSDLHKNKHITIVMVTHEPEYAKLADRTVVLKDGEIIS